MLPMYGRMLKKFRVNEKCFRCCKAMSAGNQIAIIFLFLLFFGASALFFLSASTFSPTLALYWLCFASYANKMSNFFEIPFNGNYNEGLPYIFGAT